MKAVAIARVSILRMSIILKSRRNNVLSLWLEDGGRSKIKDKRSQQASARETLNRYPDLTSAFKKTVTNIWRRTSIVSRRPRNRQG